MPVADLLPHSTGPYVSLMILGFVIAACGHVTRSRSLVLVGIVVIFLAAALFPIALNVTNEAPEQPGPVPTPY